MTIEHSYNDFVSNLLGIYDEREATNIANWVFENVTGLDNLKRRANEKKELAETLQSKVKDYLQQLLQHKPVQYVLREAWFYKMKFYVNEDVLIPRPETEELVSWIVEDVNKNDSIKILDVGIGSGCIAIALKKNIPDADITAVDISENALTVANKNARELNASIRFIQADFLNDQSSYIPGRYGIIVSNPPYIPLEERTKLSKNVTDFEPAVALFVTNEDSFVFYRAIAEFSQTHLTEEGKIYVEIHEDYADEVRKIFLENNFVTEIRDDMYGKKRMIKATRK